MAFGLLLPRRMTQALFVASLHHSNAPVALRERLALGPTEIAAVLRDVASAGDVAEAMVLWTCNRVEVYGLDAAPARAVDLLLARLCDARGVAIDLVLPHLTVRTGEEAVRHVFRVASSLDSIVVGESQVLGQLKDAFAVAQAFEVAKRVRTETALGQHAVSVVPAIVACAGRPRRSARRRSRGRSRGCATRRPRRGRHSRRCPPRSWRSSCTRRPPAAGVVLNGEGREWASAVIEPFALERGTPAAEPVTPPATVERMPVRSPALGFTWSSPTTRKKGACMPKLGARLGTTIAGVAVAALLTASPGAAEWKAPASASGLANPVSGAGGAAKAIETSCASCHGTGGKGDGPASAALPSKPADWTSDAVQKQTDGELYWKISTGRGPMPPWKHLPEKDRWEMVNYIRSLKR